MCRANLLYTLDTRIDEMDESCKMSSRSVTWNLFYVACTIFAIAVHHSAQTSADRSGRNCLYYLINLNIFSDYILEYISVGICQTLMRALDFIANILTICAQSKSPSPIFWPVQKTNVQKVEPIVLYFTHAYFFISVSHNRTKGF